jgi:hypothetical protein
VPDKNGWWDESATQLSVTWDVEGEKCKVCVLGFVDAAQVAEFKQTITRDGPVKQGKKRAKAQ